MTITFDDEALLDYLEQNDARYKEDANGLIEILSGADGKVFPIEVPKGTDNVILERLKICGDIHTPISANYFRANALEIMHGDFDSSAHEIEFKSLKTAGLIYAHDAFRIEADELIKSKHINFGFGMANYDNKSLFCSDLIGSTYKRVSVFNKNSNMVQINYYPWLPLDTMEDIIQSIYSPYSGTQGRYLKFLSKCKEKMRP